MLVQKVLVLFLAVELLLSHVVATVVHQRNGSHLVYMVDQLVMCRPAGSVDCTLLPAELWSRTQRMQRRNEATREESWL